MTPLRFILTAIIIAGISTLVFYGCKNQGVTPAGPKLPPGIPVSDASSIRQRTDVYGQPMITFTAATLQSIDITFTAGTDGAPAGFTIQWMPQSTFINNGKVWPLDTTLFCGASFSGNVSLSNYSLAASGNTVTVRIGDLLLDNGGLSNCADNLSCGTTYVFRAFAHGDSKESKSEYSAIQTFSTISCPTGACVIGGQGYWANSVPVANWPDKAAGGLTLGNSFYKNDQLLSILTYKSAGNGLLEVAHQLIPALLNQLAGAKYDPAAIAAAQAYIGRHIISPVVGSVTTTVKGVTDSRSAADIVGEINSGDHTCTN